MERQVPYWLLRRLPSSVPDNRLIRSFVDCIANCRNLCCRNLEAEKGAPEWENQQIFRVNKEDSRCTDVPYHTSEQANALHPLTLTPEEFKNFKLEDRLKGSSWYRSLNGEWKFYYSGNPEDRPRAFYKVDYDDSKWDQIQVPSNWQTKGYGTMNYSNTLYPFKKDPPRVMGTPPPFYNHFPEVKRNPVGSYRRTFKVPLEWKSRRVFVVFDGVDSAFYLWFNGQFIGYSQDSRTAAEFDLTPYINWNGENTMAAEVYKHCDGSYLEDQDMWRMSGIFRDVYIWSSSPLNLADYEIIADLDRETYKTGRFAMTARIRYFGLDDRAPFTLQADLVDIDGKIVAQHTLEGAVRAEADYKFTTNFVEIPSVRTWSAEIPNLYRLQMTLTDTRSGDSSYHACKVGFRTSEIKDGLLQINGRPIYCKGFNRHEFDMDHGHVMSEELIRKDMMLMKSLNVNAIRCSHYPNVPVFYDLADEFGFYVIDEANLESHGMGWGPNAVDSLARVPSWEAAHLDRVKNMLERDKNHPCIIVWSMGNEAGDGLAFIRASAWLHQRDPRRPVQYEQAQERPHVDFFAPMYADLDQCANYAVSEESKPKALRRPLIQCEYSHAMGNSCGNLWDYWMIYRRYRHLQGGFIWVWGDQTPRRYKQPIDAVKDDSKNSLKTILAGVLHENEGLHAGGVLVDHAPVLDFVDKITLVAECKANACGRGGDESGNSDGYPIITKGDTAYSLKFDSSGSSLEFFVYSGSWQTIRAKLPEDFQSQFHTYAGVCTGNRLQLYIDGEEVMSRPFKGTIHTNTSRLGIGLNEDIAARWFDGSIRNARVFDRVLSGSDMMSKHRDAVLDIDFTKAAKEEGTRQYFAYGGDYGDRPTQGSFCANGVVMANRNLSPQAPEVFKVHQSIHTELSGLAKNDGIRISVFNEHTFEDLGNYGCTWDLFEDGEIVAKGTLDSMDLGPGEKVEVSLFPRQNYEKIDASKEYHVKVQWRRQQDQIWGGRDDLVAWDQFPLPWGSRPSPLEMEESPAAIERPLPTPLSLSLVNTKPGVLEVQGDRLSVGFDRASGYLASVNWDGTEYVSSQVPLNFWRPPTSNDSGCGFHDSLRPWLAAGTEAKLTGLSTDVQPHKVSIKVTLALSSVGSTSATIVYDVYVNGKIHIRPMVKLRQTWGPGVVMKVGMQMSLSKSFSNWTWFGKGPTENYVDRKAGCWIGKFNGRVDELFHPYMNPQESSNRTEIRWSTFTNDEGKGIQIDTGPTSNLLEVSAYPATMNDIELARHPIDIPERDNFTVNVDGKVQGIGGINTWGHWPLDQYLVRARNADYAWSFVIQPIY